MTDIEAILKATIQAKVIEAFNDAPDVVEKLVRTALEKEVDQHGGKPSSYGAERMPYMDWLVGEEIRRAVLLAVREYVESNKSDITKKVHQAIHSSAFGKSLGDTLGEVLSEQYRWNVDLKIDKYQ